MTVMTAYSRLFSLEDYAWSSEPQQFKPAMDEQEAERLHLRYHLALYDLEEENKRPDKAQKCLKG